MQSVNLKIAGRWKRRLLLCGLCVLSLAGASAFGEKVEHSERVLRSRVYKLDHITSQQAQDLFKQLNIGKSYNMLSSDVLIVTSDIGPDLFNATEIINVLDRIPPAKIRSLMTISPDNPAPPLDVFAAIETISVGTMNDAPAKGADRPAIIDVRGDQLIAIGAEDVLDQIVMVFENWKKEHLAKVSEAVKEPELSLDKQLEIPDKVSLPQVQPMTSAEPNGIKPEDSELQIIDTVEPETTKEVEKIDKAQQPAIISLDEIAQEFIEPSVTVNDVNELSVEPQAEKEEDFLSEGLQEVLADAEKNTTPEKIELQTEQSVAVEPLPQTKERDDLKQQLQALLAKSEAEQQQAAEAAGPSQHTQVLAPPADVSPANETVDKTAKLERELALMRQKIAELEAKTAQQSKPDVANKHLITSVEVSPPAVERPEEEPKASEPIQTEPEIATEVANEELETVIDLPQEVELEALIDLVGKQLGLNYMYDPDKLKGQKVQLKIHGGKIKVKDTYKLLESALRFKGFIMTRRDQLVTILPQADSVKAEPVLRGVDEPIQPGDVVVSSLFELDYIDPTSAENMLKGMNLGTNFTPLEETKTLIVTDFAYRMEQIRQVLKMIDVPGEKKEYEFRTLKYMKPTEMLPKIQDLAEQLQDVSLQINAPETPAQATRQVTTRDPRTGKRVTRNVPVNRTAAPGAAAADQTPTSDSVFIDTDDRTNRILMAGRPDQIDLINELIDALDVPQYDLKTVREYIIENVEASEVVDVIQELALASVSVSTDRLTSDYDRTRTSTSRRTAASRTRQQPTPTPNQPATTGNMEEEPSQIYISIRPATNSLLVNATAEQHKALELVIAHVDVVQKDQRTIRQYEIQYVDTQEVITTLEDLGIIAPQESDYYDSYSSSSRSRSRLDRTNRTTAANRTINQQDIAPGAAAPLSLPSAEGGSEKDITADQPQISVLETTNSLLVYATPRQHDAIALVIAHADRQLDTTSTPYVVYALENQDPEELAGVLTELIQETVEEVQRASSPTDKIQTRTATTATPKLPTLEEENIRVIADPMSYSLIVYANKRNQLWISELIRELDEYRPQVLLDCTLVEVTQNEKFEYDLDIITKTYGMNNGTGLKSGNIIGSLTDFEKGRYVDARSTTSADPVFKAFFNSENVQALLTAIQSKGYGRVMARPKILVNDNQEGEIKSQNTISVAQLKSNIVPSTGDNVSAITTTDVTFNDYDAGVTLTIKPHISKGDMLRLEITLNRTDFTLNDPVSLTDGGSVRQFPSPPDRLSTDVTTVSTVPDGATIILGGLETIDQSKGHSKIPILGDIPLVGGLFRGVSDIGDQSKLYVFVKANILRPGDQVEGLDDVRRVSAKDRKAFEDMEKEFQELQDWPGIKPKPMGPEKVLGDDEVENKTISKDGYVVQDSFPEG